MDDWDGWGEVAYLPYDARFFVFLIGLSGLGGSCFDDGSHLSCLLPIPGRGVFYTSRLPFLFCRGFDFSWRASESCVPWSVEYLIVRMDVWGLSFCHHYTCVNPDSCHLCLDFDILPADV